MNSNQPYDKEKFWDATNGGLTFFEDEFASEIAANRGSLKGFRVRSNDDTGSCHIHKSKSGLYVFTDFGVTNKGVNAIDYVMQRDNCTFAEACQKLFPRYGVPIEGAKRVEPQTEFTKIITQPEGFWDATFCDKIQHTKLVNSLFPFYTEQLLEEYHFKELKSYQIVAKNDEGKLYHKTVSPTEEYPIFGYDYAENDNFVKLYEPFAPPKDKYLHKHGFIGSKPSRPIYGWDRLLQQVDLEEQKANFRLSNNPTFSKSERNEALAALNKNKLDSVIIATGGTDGINIASLGYNVIWFNSETEVINSNEYFELSLMAKDIYYIPDLDATGVRQATFMGKQHIDIKILWLPPFKDTKKKDFRDWITLNKNIGAEALRGLFKKMLTQALNFRFWDFSEKGNVQLSEMKMLHFLKCSNFYLYKRPFTENINEQMGEFIHIKGGIIRRVETSNIRAYLTEWLRNNYYPIEVQNKVARSAFFNQSQLKLLLQYQYERNHYGKDFQFFCFKNEQRVRISKESIELCKEGTYKDVLFWEENVINHCFTLEAPFFEVKTDACGRKRLNLLRMDSDYLKVLINTSRIYWKKDADDEQNDLKPFAIHSENLTDDENYTQELHLMNKMYCVGYLLHRYKSDSLTKMVLGVDFEVATTSKQANGGTGKTFLQKVLEKVVKWKSIGGDVLQKSAFPMDGVTPKTDIVTFDDLYAFQDYRQFFTLITGNFVANQKGGVIYDIPFNEAPKVGATTNYPPDLSNGAAKRRLLVYLNSDYYHTQTEENDYKTTRQISDSFGGKNILTKESTESQWNADYNFILQCVQFYLSCEKPIEAPLGKLIDSSYLMRVGEHYIQFFKDYFAENEVLDTWFERNTIQNEAKEALGKKYSSPQQFREKLEMYCRANGWELDVKKRRNSMNVSTPHFLIITHTQEPTNNEPVTDAAQEQEDNIDIDDLAF